MKIYANHLEQTALDQFNDAMSQKFAVDGALMPDAHTGYSLPIGAVVATKDIIVPAWVGYDIGCGMCALPTTFNYKNISEESEWIFEKIYKSVPVGFKSHKHEIETHLDTSGLTSMGFEAFLQRGGFRALGTLGGGNHFIEVGIDESEQIWIIIHSGSRGVGHGIASYYMSLASNDTEKIGIEFDLKNEKLKTHNPDKYASYRNSYIEKERKKFKPKEGHFGFNVDSKNGKDYINDLNWALVFALENRKHMMRTIIKTISRKCDGFAKWDDLINRNHNHAEERDGLWIHRKGATHAENGMMGVIPGNMRDGSFIVKGKGNPESLYSSSHGAGRVMGRKQAKRELETEDFIKTMEGITALVGDKTLDESPMAYKNIFEVMELQKDLVDIIHHVKPIINIKG